MQKQVIYLMQSDKYPFGQHSPKPTSPPTMQSLQKTGYSPKIMVKKIYTEGTADQHNGLIYKIWTIKKMNLLEVMRIETVLELDQENTIHVLYEYVPVSLQKLIPECDEDFICKKIFVALKNMASRLSEAGISGDIWDISYIGLTQSNQIKCYIDFRKIQILQPKSFDKDAIYLKHETLIAKMLSSYTNILPKGQYHKQQKKQIIKQKSAAELLRMKPFTEFRMSSSVQSSSSRSETILCTGINLFNKQGQIKSLINPNQTSFDNKSCTPNTPKKNQQARFGNDSNLHRYTSSCYRAPINSPPNQKFNININNTNKICNNPTIKQSALDGKTDKKRENIKHNQRKIKGNWQHQQQFMNDFLNVLGPSLNTGKSNHNDDNDNKNIKKMQQKTTQKKAIQHNDDEEASFYLEGLNDDSDNDSQYLKNIPFDGINLAASCQRSEQIIWCDQVIQNKPEIIINYLLPNNLKEKASLAIERSRQAIKTFRQTFHTHQ